MDNTGAGVLSSLAGVNGEVAIVLQAGALVAPLVKGIIKEIKAGIGGGTVTIEYTTAIQEGQANLDHAIATDDAVLAAVNAELVRQGVAPLPTPDATPPAAGTGG